MQQERGGERLLLLRAGWVTAARRRTGAPAIGERTLLPPGVPKLVGTRSGGSGWSSRDAPGQIPAPHMGWGPPGHLAAPSIMGRGRTNCWDNKAVPGH